MVDWRKWPKAETKVADPRSLPAWVTTSEVLKETRREVWVSMPVILSAIVIPGAAAYSLFSRFAPSGTGTVAVWIAIGTFGTVVASFLGLGFFGEEWSARRRSRRVLDTLEARGEPVLGDQVVGVTYSDTIWRSNIYGDAWDWGALRLEMDRLSYIGRNSRFELKPESILGLQIKRYENFPGQPHPRLFLEWNDNGRTETLILELPYKRTRKRRVEAMEELRERIERWRREPLPSHDRTPLTPPLRSADLQPAVNPYLQLGRPAKLLSAVVTIAIAVVFQVSLVLLTVSLGFRDIGPYLGGLAIVYMFLWLLLAQKIEKQLPLRWQHPSKRMAAEAVDHLTEAPFGASISEEERSQVKA